MRVIHETDDCRFRIIEVADDATFDDLAGDMFNRDVNPDIDEETLQQQENHFRELIEREGVFGYILERWNPAPGVGYEHVESCYGFVGQYSQFDRSGLFNHDVVNDFMAQIADDDK